MAETSFSWSQIESPAAGARLAPGRHRVRGWVWPKAGNHFADVRARVGLRRFPGLHGIPRPDVAAHFRASVALAEFEVVVTLEPGDTVIDFEALEIDGRWSPFESTPIVVDPMQPWAEIASPPDTPISWLGFLRLAEAVLRRADGVAAPTWSELARAVVASLGRPRDLRPAQFPFVGFIDEPVPLTCARYGRIPVFGHLFHATQKITRMFASVDLQVLQPLDYAQASPGPAAFYTQYTHAKDCGFAGFVDVAAQLPNPASLRLYAELADGSLHLVQATRVSLHSAEAEKTPLAASAAEFPLLVAAIDEALAAASIGVQRGPEWTRMLGELERRATRRTARVRSRPSVQSAPLSPEHLLPHAVILATHSLAPQGAPRFLLDLSRALVRAGVDVQIVSAEEGPLHAEFTLAGARVTVVDLTTAFTESDFRSAWRALDWGAADLVIANTFTAFWAVHAARAAGRPSLLYLHESTTPEEFYGARVPAWIVALAEESIELASAVSFTTATTARYHGGRVQWLTPGWVDVAAIDTWRQQRSRAASRARFELQAGEQLVCNIGTVSDRKGQHTFVRAIDLLWRRYPALAARTRFVLLGGRESAFDATLASTLASINRPNIAVHRETMDYLDYYQAADLFACSSYEESSPRVVLEAMAVGAPILASDVHGIPELVRADLEATLVPPGDTAAWCEALAKLLSAPQIGSDLAARARARVVAHFEAATVVPRHLALLAHTASARII